MVVFFGLVLEPPKGDALEKKKTGPRYDDDDDGIYLFGWPAGSSSCRLGYRL